MGARKESKTEAVAKALALADLNTKGRAMFSDRYWQQAFAPSERAEYRRKARFVLIAIKR